MVGDHTGILGAVVFAYDFHNLFFGLASGQRPALKSDPPSNVNKCKSQHYKLNPDPSSSTLKWDNLTHQPDDPYKLYNKAVKQASRAN